MVTKAEPVKLGAKLLVIKPGTLAGCVVSVVDVEPDKITARIVRQPSTEVFKDYRKAGGKLFYLSSLIFLHSGEFVPVADCPECHGEGREPSRWVPVTNGPFFTGGGPCHFCGGLSDA